MTRQKQLWTLIVLTAITMMPQYAMQGWLAVGNDPQSIVWWFDLIEAGTWSLRALIEALVLGFLFSIQAKEATPTERKILLAFECALILLIALTLGPTLASIGRKSAITDYLHPWLHPIWTFGLASYGPLMLGATGFAFKLETRNPAKDKAQEKSIPKKQPSPKTKSKPIATTDQDKIALTLALIETGEATNKAEIARRLEENPSTTGRRFKRLESEGKIQKNGKGYEVLNGAK